MQGPVLGHGGHTNAPHPPALLTWAQAIHLIVASSKGISAKKLGEMLGVSYETAWHLGHRIRAMIAEDNPLLSNLVEINEMYAGAPPRKRAKPEHEDDDRDPPPPDPKGRGTKRPLVLVAAERDGDVAAKVIPPHGKEASPRHSTERSIPRPRR